MGIMKVIMAAVSILLSFALAIPAQVTGGFTGRWETGYVFNEPWKIELAVVGKTVSGSVGQGRGLPVKIFDGNIKGNTVTFRCASPDGDRTIIFTGILEADAIEFTRDVQVREGGRPGDYGIFGLKAPRQFIARRVKPGDAKGVQKRTNATSAVRYT